MITTNTNVNINTTCCIWLMIMFPWNNRRRLLVMSRIIGDCRIVVGGIQTIIIIMGVTFQECH